PSEWKAHVLPVLEHFVDRTPGSFVEHKEYGLVWHHRMADPEFGEWLANELVAVLEELLAGAGLRAGCRGKALGGGRALAEQGRGRRSSRGRGAAPVLPPRRGRRPNGRGPLRAPGPGRVDGPRGRGAVPRALSAVDGPCRAPLPGGARRRKLNGGGSSLVQGR